MRILNENDDAFAKIDRVYKNLQKEKQRNGETFILISVAGRGTPQSIYDRKIAKKNFLINRRVF